MKTAKAACVTLLLSLIWTAPSLAQQQRAPVAAPACLNGTKDGACLNAIVASSSTLFSRILVYDANRYIPPVMPTLEAGVVDPLHFNAKHQEQFGLNATGPFAITGGGSANYVYGRRR